MVGQKAEAQEASCASARGVVDRWRLEMVVGGGASPRLLSVRRSVVGVWLAPVGDALMGPWGFGGR
jgi:hypothetical protein